jgi:hypothetical protein
VKALWTGTKLKGDVGVCHPPKLDWQGKSSGLAGQIIWIGRAMKDFKFQILVKNKGFMPVLTGICRKNF